MKFLEGSDEYRSSTATAARELEPLVIFAHDCLLYLVRGQGAYVVHSRIDADADGANYAEIVRQAVLLSGLDDLSFIFQEPFGFKDWNDQLRAKNGTFLCSLPCGAIRRLSLMVEFRGTD